MKNITAKAIANQCGASVKLVNSVIRQLGGRESLRDIARHGAGGGFCGFTYYSDTVAFFKRNKADILALVESMADSLGEEPLAMVAGFNCLRPADAETRRSVARCLYGRMTSDDANVANALAWFAAEEVARAYDDLASY